MIRVRLDLISQRGVISRLNQYRRLTGKTRREVTVELGKACAKEIASKVQPFGLSAKIGKAFEGSIAKQVNRAVRNAEISPGTGNSVSAAHAQRRDGNGQVPRNLRMKGRRTREPFMESEVSRLIQIKKENAGIAKGAWIAAGESLGGGKIPKIPKWIRRHATRNGTSDIGVSASTTTVVITSQLGYAEKTITSSNLRAALKTAYNNQWKRMTIQIKKIRGEI